MFSFLLFSGLSCKENNVLVLSLLTELYNLSEVEKYYLSFIRRLELVLGMYKLYISSKIN